MLSSHPSIQAVTVNHNTSHFVELLVRTLVLTSDLSTLDLQMTVLDNASDDEHVITLTSYLDTQHITVTQTGFDTSVAVEKHGIALESFVQHHPACTHYLFLDPDIWFVEPDTIRTMLDELISAEPSIFANQARIAGYYAGRLIEGRDATSGTDPYLEQPVSPIICGNRQYDTCVASRCSPVCSLVTNTPLFRRVVETVGLSPALRLRVDQATYYDTFSLMTHVMATHDKQAMVSAKTINHFTQVAYEPEYRPPKDRDCLLMLQDLRAGCGITGGIFFESAWVKQQREERQ